MPPRQALQPREEAGTAEPKLYHELAEWWPLLSAPADYAQEVAQYRRLFVEACDTPPRTLLDLGSGGGNNASHLKQHFALTLVDRSQAMLAVSRALNPECEHVAADMRTMRLGRLFDLVLVHDAVSYLTTEVDLRAALETAALHCRTAGAALFVPDWIRETFRPYTKHGGHDGAARGLRYVEWAWDPDPTDTSYTVDFAYLLRNEGSGIRVEHDRHLNGLFARDQWTRWLASAGFSPEVRRAAYDDEDGGGELFLARRVA